MLERKGALVAKAAESLETSVVYLGLLDLNVGRVISHLRRDLRDDWFPDVLNYSDSLTVEFIRSRLADLQQDPLKGYVATERVVRDIPKAGGALRYSLETTLIDRFVYQALVHGGTWLPYIHRNFSSPY
jgi:hypothetical protein